MMPLDWSRYPHFAEHEFRCRCGCGRADMDATWLATLERIRGVYGRPMLVTSGFRCPSHNALVSPGTGTTGPHTTGRATDFATPGSADALELVAAALTCGVRRIGVNGRGPHDGRFIHLDDAIAAHIPRPAIWSY